VPGPGGGRLTEADGGLRGAFGFDEFLVTLENEAPTLAARSRAPLAAPATAAIGDVVDGAPSGLGGAGDVSDGGGWLVPACQAGAGALSVWLAPVVAGDASADDVEPCDITPSELSPGVALPEPSPDARDGASTRFSTPSSSALFTDTRLSPSQLSVIRSYQNRSHSYCYDADAGRNVAIRRRAARPLTP